MLSCGGCGLPCQLLSHGVHGLLSSCWTTTADPMRERWQILVKHHFYFSVVCLLACFDVCHHSLSKQVLQSKTGMIPQTCLLNISVAKFGNHWSSRVVWICSRAMFMSPPELAHVLNVHFKNMMHTSTCLLLWW